MKLNQAPKTFETNAEVTSQDFTIGDTSVVIEILRNKLYRHKVRTLVQEYLSNARDAMREINSKEQIEVTVPTPFNATFKVRDFGPGIDQDRMYNVFIKYASSTKRTSNTQTGGFGIGAKSAWSYTEAFTIVTFIDGVKRTYTAHIGANNNGRLDFLGEETTTERNGTEIQIPVNPKDASEFKRAIIRATYFWSDKEKPIYKGLNVEDSIVRKEGNWIDNIEINNDLLDYIMSKWTDGIVISIDGIPYVLETELVEKVAGLSKLSKALTGKLVLHVENGQLEVSASREEISDSKYSLSQLDKFGNESHAKVIRLLNKEFSKAKTPFDHLTLFMKYNASYNLDKFRQFGDFEVTNNGRITSKLFENVKIFSCTTYNVRGQNRVHKRELGANGRSRYSRNDDIKAENFNDLYYLKPGTETMILSNQRIAELLLTTKEVILFSPMDTDAGQFQKCVDGLGLKDLTKTQFTPVVKTRQSRAIERTKQEFCVHNCSRLTHRIETTSLERNNTEWLYLEKGQKKYDVNELFELSRYLEATRKVVVCELGAETIRRVKGDKNFKPLQDFLDSFKPSQSDIKAFKKLKKRNPEQLEVLMRIKGIKDNFITEMIEEYKENSKEVLPNILKQLLDGKVKEVQDFDNNDKKFYSLLNDKYVLLNYMTIPQNNAKVLTEVADYINSK